MQRAMQRAQVLAASVAAGTLDFFLYEWFEAQRAEAWGVLRSQLPLPPPRPQGFFQLPPTPAGVEQHTAASSTPILFIYSWDDVLAPGGCGGQGPCGAMCCSPGGQGGRGHVVPFVLA